MKGLFGWSFKPRSCFAAFESRSLLTLLRGPSQVPVYRSARQSAVLVRNFTAAAESTAPPTQAETMAPGHSKHPASTSKTTLENLTDQPFSQLQISPATKQAIAQIEAEAQQLIKFHNLSAQVVFGGTNINADVRRFKQNMPSILIATPGRLNDHLQNGKLAEAMRHLRVLVFDEADRLLDMGFRRDIDIMMKHLPSKETRQTVLFSATFPRETNELCKYALRQDLVFVDTIGEDSEQTANRVSQSSVVLPLAQQMPALYQIISDHKAVEPSHKIMVFFTTANQTAFASALFEAAGQPIMEMHSRKSQAQRTKTADRFRNAREGIMFSSDVSARGVDYPDVTLVVQVGVPSEKAQYVHRVGRTARAGKSGSAVLLLADFEAYFIRQLTDLPVKPMQLAPEAIAASQQRLDSSMPRVSESTKGKAYQAFLGFYKGQRGLKWSSAQLVEQANYYASIMGCPEPPAILAKTVGMMGLKGTPGLNIVKGKQQLPGPDSPRPAQGRGNSQAFGQSRPSAGAVQSERGSQLDQRRGGRGGASRSKGRRSGAQRRPQQ
ncbi:hypothetical protein WJX73_005803 [Symbiochloris irregularis]|uniref:ATP-dependent RNA helicase n=1 Tax=Symbiochloris irregularis TaxID=706552 RepID=A0AAW1NVC2_9CHLO